MIKSVEVYEDRMKKDLNSIFYENEKNESKKNDSHSDSRRIKK